MSTTIEAPALTAAQAVALTFLRDGYSDEFITARTDTEPGDLHRLAALHGITAPRRSVPIPVLSARLARRGPVR